MIEIINYEPVSKGKIVGYVDASFLIGGYKLILRKIAHFKYEDREWLHLPKFSRTSSDGSNYYYCYWQFENEKNNAKLLDAIRAVLKEYLARTASSPSIPGFDFVNF